MMAILADAFAPLLEQGFGNASEADRMRYGVLGFTRLAEASAPGMVATAQAWEPDLVVHDAVDFAGPLAAATIDVPTVTFGWGTWLPPQVDEAVADALAPVYRRFELSRPPAGPAARVDVCPPSLTRGHPHATHLRFVPYNGAGEMPTWLLEPKRRRRVLVTFGGTVGGGQSQLGGPLLDRVLDALRDVDADVVVAAASADGVPSYPNVRVAAWLPLSHVLPGCDLVIHHGGSGTSLSAAAFGVPQLVLPQMADQFRFAAAVTARRAGEQVLPHEATPEAIAGRLQRILSSACWTAGADELSNEIAALPPVSMFAEIVEHAAEQPPILAVGHMSAG